MARTGKIVVGEADDNFGTSVALDGDLIIIGAFLGDNDNGKESGSAHIYSHPLSDSAQSKNLF